jgi:hypothetical protein
MSTLNSASDLSDDESTQLWTKLNEIMKLGDQMATDGASRGHHIYKLARDCRDLLVFDQQSRQIMRNLTAQEEYAGLELSDTVKALAKNNRKIEAIKELRTQSGCGLKEAKDAVEAYMQKLGISTW